MKIPEGFPQMSIPEDNAFSISRWELGKHLFYDNALSVDYQVSCASCHQQQNGFADSRTVSIGAGQRPGTRNSPTLANVGYLPYYTREGGVPTLEMQVLVPIQEHNEFDFNLVKIVERLKDDPYYKVKSLEAYQRPFDHFVVTRALACFERTLISGNSKYDNVQHEGESFTDSESRGEALFFSRRTQCSTCHNGFNFTTNDFANTGLYEHYEDEGKFRLTREEKDRAVFRIPSLRNVGFTAPYMHDGSMSDLYQVVAHYNSGGHDHMNKSDLIKPLDLTESEQHDLVAFLHTLSDYEFISNPIFK